MNERNDPREKRNDPYLPDHGGVATVEDKSGLACATQSV